MLSVTSEYALRALAHLAQRPDDAVLGRDLAHAVQIPANYLSKVLLTLRKAGLVDTARGSGGGYRLGKPASEIHLIDVVELFERVSRSEPSCFLSHNRPCSNDAPCPAHAYWRGIQAAYLGFLLSTPVSAIAGVPGDAWKMSEGEK
ncbi:MAG: Rrf2 family transcriptional regulator [Acidobacteria bacterium]|jgi:cysteine desulfurase|nr:Rrf2 family transcriptional regulator [Acidobacteriota bacterium]